MLSGINQILGTASVLFFLGLTLTSLAEKENRAFWVSGGLTLSAAVFWIAIPAAGTGVNLAVILFLIAFSIVSFVRFFPSPAKQPRGVPSIQYDERDTMFARNNIQHYPDLMEQYFNMRPETRSTDLQIHNKPEFGSPEQRFHDDYTAPVYDAAFEYLAQTIPLSDGVPSPEQKEVDKTKFAACLKDMVHCYGGCDTGIIPLASHHFYSHKGRHADNFGDKTDQTYKTAIVIVVPMRTVMLKQSPTASVIQESAQKYVEAAKISNIMAGYIRKFGYRARAHNDANYETLCVPLAVESGMGELGRMGLFMHKVYGPCVRLAVVTTDLELPPTRADRDLNMAHFCRICKKCADNCPSGSVLTGDEPESRGCRHWSIDQERCFSYWKSIGSDCGQCVSVCPYTKPDTIMHKLVRHYISRNALNQHIALLFDDLLYGRKRQIPAGNPARILKPGD